MWTLMTDFMEFIIWPPVRKLSIWYAGHLRKKEKWWHP